MPNTTLKRWNGTAWVELLLTPAPHTHNATDITAGILATARLGTGTQDATTFLRGDGTWSTFLGELSTTAFAGSRGLALETLTTNIVNGTQGLTDTRITNSATTIQPLIVNGIASTTADLLRLQVGSVNALEVTKDGIINKSVADSVVITQNGIPILSTFKHPTGNTNIPSGQNTFVGRSGNTTMGSTATTTTQGSFNTAVGYDSLITNTTGFTNSAFGNASMRSNTSGSGNTAVGAVALRENTTGGSNSALGSNAGRTITTGSNNTFVGSNAGYTGAWGTQLATATNSTAIGNEAFTDASNQMVFGNASVTQFKFDRNSGALVLMPQTSISSETFPPLQVQRTSTGTNASLGAVLFKNKTSADMLNEFGINFEFAIEDNANVNNVIARIGAVRSAGQDNSGRIVFKTTSAGTDTEKMTIMPDGKVGIGTATPAVALSVFSTSNSDGIQIRRGSSSTNASSFLGFVFQTVDVTTNYAEIRATRTNRAVAQDTDLIFRTISNSSLGERMRIRDDGNVGIGTSAPATKLDIADATLPILRLTNSNSSMATGQEVGRLEFYNSDLSGAAPKVEGSISVNVSNVGNGLGGNLIFSTGENVSSPEGVAPIERMRIDENGLVGINETTLSAQLQVKSGATTRIPLIVDTLASHTANLAEWRVNGTALNVMTSAGNLGIGVSSPPVRLSVDANVASILRISRSGGTNANTIFEIKQATTSWFFGASTPNDFSFRYNDANISTSPQLTIKSGGNVGIGTTTPSEKLDVNGNITVGISATGQFIDVNNGTADLQRLRLTTSGTDAVITATRASGAVPNMLFRIQADEAMRVTAGRLIGINETSPSAQLQVKSNATDRVGLIVDTLASQTANLQEWKVNGSILSRIGSGGSFISSATIFATSGLANGSTGNNSIFVPGANGALITRNIADANTTLTVNSIHASSTGNLLNLQASGTNVVSFKRDGTLLAPATFTIDPSGHGDITGKVIILGDLQVDGTTTTINSTTIDVADKNILLSKGATNKAASDGAGITIDLGTDGTASLLYGSTADLFSLNKGLNIAGQTSITSATFPPLLAERTTTETNIILGSQRNLLTTTGDMTDGFGSAINFSIRDNANVINSIADIAAVRSGADTSGRLVFQTTNAGSSTEKMTILPSGNVGIGITNPTNKLEVDGAIKLTDSFELKFGGNTATIFGSSTNNTMGLYTNNTPRIWITSAGNVGIGTTSPSTKLDVNGVITSSGTTNKSIAVQSGTNNYAYYGNFSNFAIMGVNRNPSTGDFADINKASADIAMLGDNGSSYISFETTNTNNSTPSERMRITGAGNVGIGTTSPVAPLQVATANAGLYQRAIKLATGSTDNGSGAFIHFPSGTNDALGSFFGGGREGAGAASFFKFETTNSSSVVGERVRITSDGNVGIGTSSPSAKLDVVGDVKHTGLTMTTGTNVDQTKETTFTSALTTAWTDVTGVSGTYLATGSYIVQIESNGEYYTGTMAWFSGTTTSTTADEIVLHRAGPAASAGRIFARVIRTSSAPSTLKLQVSGSDTISSHTMTFKFRRTI